VGEQAAVAGAMLRCSFGAAPCSLDVLPDRMVLVEGRPAAAISDSSLINVASFGMCMTLSNPEVASATAAALGVLTPMPCVPVLSPWVPTTTTLIGGELAVTASSTCLCAYGGVIEVLFAGTTRTFV
jgi:hypothetical protein